ncbi:MAG: histidinol-phosphate phosphatase family protein [Bacteroidetes bacterium]|jgi:D-glycero-D-manno-heptose 1,7-bisphosphate phosphatase|nr:histidinol-phosphate phosphatase family protein [Bacteroidota bacterium]
MNKAIFLDRDGVINVERGYIHRLEDFVILPDLVENLQMYLAKGYLLLVVSNQSGIAKGLYTQAEVETIHSFLTNELTKSNIHLSEIYYCIHHPDVSKCICRKPDSLFVEKALARFNIDPSKSYFIGDKERDVEAAEKAGVKGILIEANSPLKLISHIIE